MQNIDQYTSTRQRRQFGRQCNFTDRTQYLFCVQPSLKRRMDYVLRNPIDRATQLAPQYADSEAETINPELDNHGMNHYEGGWPKDVNLRDEEQTLRYRKKVEREDEWGSQVLPMIKKSMVVTAQNSAISIYQRFFSDLPADMLRGLRREFELRPRFIFHDPMRPSRPITSINWSHNRINNFLVVFTNYAGIPQTDDILMAGPLTAGTTPRREGESDVDEVAFYETWRGACTQNSFFIWDCTDTLEPATTLDSEQVVRCAAFCPKDDAYVAGGFQSGAIGVWETRSGGMPTSICSLEASHTEQVSAVCWVHSKGNTEFYTGSSDGSLKFWDLRNLDQPTREVLLDPMLTDDQKRSRAEGVSCIEFEYTIPVRFIVCSDHGRIFIGNRKFTTSSDIFSANYHLFSGPIHTIERNPFFVKNFILTADWCAKVWAEECKDFATRIVFKKKNEIFCGTWSTTRCSLVITGDETGQMDFWDLLLSHREPVYSMNFGIAINCLTFRADDLFLAVGLENGDLYLVELNEAMRGCTSKDKSLIAALFERELLRCKLLEARVDEVRLKRYLIEQQAEERAAAQAQAEADEAEQTLVLNPDNPDEYIQIVEKDTEFAEMLRKFEEVVLAVEKKRQNRTIVNERTHFEEFFDYLESLQPPPSIQEIEEDAVTNISTTTKEADKPKKKKKIK